MARSIKEKDWIIVEDLGASAAILFENNNAAGDYFKDPSGSSNLQTYLGSIASDLKYSSTMENVKEAGLSFYKFTSLYKSLNSTYFNQTTDGFKSSASRNFFNGLLWQYFGPYYPFWEKTLTFNVNELNLNLDFISSHFQAFVQGFEDFSPYNAEFLNATQV